MATKATHVEIDAVSLCVMAEHIAVSVHRSAEGLRTCGTTIGAIRINAPLPAEGCPHFHQGPPLLS